MAKYIVAVVMTTAIYREVEADSPHLALTGARAGDDKELGQLSEVTGAYIVPKAPKDLTGRPYEHDRARLRPVRKPTVATVGHGDLVDRFKMIAPMAICRAIKEDDTVRLVDKLDDLKGSYAVEYVLRLLLEKDVKDTVPGLLEKIESTRQKR